MAAPSKPPKPLASRLGFCVGCVVIGAVGLWFFTIQAHQKIEDGTAKDPDTAGKLAWGWGVVCTLLIVGGLIGFVVVLRESRRARSQ